MPVNESQISLAIQDLDSGQFTSVKAAAIAYGIPRSTLRDRLKGSQNKRAAHVNQQRLSQDQEEFLVDWIIEQDSQGFPPSHTRAREMAIRVLRSGGDYPLGKAWLPKFIQRNPRVTSCIGRRIDASRIHGTQPAAIQEFYNLFSKIKEQYNILPENIWNMDEHGIALGVCTNSQVLAASGRKHTCVKSPENREWVSIIETISPTGKTIRPLIIFKGKNPQTSWFQTDIPDWLYTTSENGWTSNLTGIEWLKTIFLPETAISDQYRLLILDGHGSHTSIDFLWICKQSKVELVFLPAHSSHVLQPLDLGTFSSVKAKYRNQINALSYIDDAAPIKKVRFVECYSKAREQSFKPTVLQSGWKAAGLVPWDPTKGLNSSQLRIQPTSIPQKRQTTPPFPQDSLETIFNTPQSHRQVQKVKEVLQKQQNLTRDQTVALEKAGKAIGILTAKQAADGALISKLNSQVETFKRQKKKKRVTVDPNTQFTDIEKIKAAQLEAEALAERQRQKEPEKEAKKASNQMAAMALQDMMFEFQT